MRIAVVGGGISGLGAALILEQGHQVTVFEAEERLGGHSRTVDVRVDGKELAVDTGFIVHNRATYPLLTGLFAELGIETVPASMSFGVHARDGRYSWSSHAGILSYFGSLRNLSSAAHWRLIPLLSGFFRQAQDYLATPQAAGGGDLSLGGWLDSQKVPQLVRDRYVLPMGAAIWSTSQDRMLDFPARNLLSFLDNHRLLQFRSQHDWMTVKGGSRSYVEAIRNRLHGAVIHHAARGIVRGPEGVRITAADGSAQEFDALVLACHADQGLACLSDPDPREIKLLGAVRYERNEAVLHTDRRLMPTRRSDWASWVSVVCSPGTPHTVNYWMNSLQRLPVRSPVIVSLNPASEPDEAHVLDRHEYMHPQFDGGAIKAQAGIQELQGHRSTYYCGAWLRNGFHEDGLWSAVEVGRRLGIDPPW